MLCRKNCIFVANFGGVMWPTIEKRWELPISEYKKAAFSLFGQVCVKHGDISITAMDISF